MLRPSLLALGLAAGLAFTATPSFAGSPTALPALAIEWPLGFDDARAETVQFRRYRRFGPRYRRFGPRYRYRRRILPGVVGGLVVGGLLIRGARLRDHHEWCEDRYRSYRRSDGTYQPYGGVPRRLCNSPFDGI